MKFFHINSPEQSRATVAMDVVLGNLMVAFAKCSPNDQFNKKIGREVAGGRLQAFLDGKPRKFKHVFNFGNATELGQAEERIRKTVTESGLDFF